MLHVTLPTLSSDSRSGVADSLDAPALTSLLLSAAQALQDRSAELSELDRAIGDGDHGTTMARAAGRIRERLTSDPPTDIGGVLRVVGTVFLDLDGGATGPIFGTFFGGMATAAGDRDRVDAPELGSLFEGGLAAVRGLTRANPGDKTLMDALVPAVEAAQSSAADDEPIASQLDAAASAAEAGALATRDVRARFGRARHLGDRVVGHEDPGARSIAILFRALAAESARNRTLED
jgi:phosphoenolpyruvate---glycerone phosphotransferase subunit DhaL